jgi:hypothetical protein
VQAMLKDGGISFKCVQSSAWRTDSKCYESPSDFMTAGEHFSTAQQQIPAVPKGFVRWVQLNNINAPSERKLKKDDRRVHYIFCGDANVVPDTAGWAPFGEEFKAAMADKRGSQRISSMRSPQSAPNRLSVETCLKENPLLKSAGVTLEHFNFSRWKGFGGATLSSTVPTASPAPRPSYTFSQQPTVAQEALLPRERPATTLGPLGVHQPKLPRTSGNDNAALPAVLPAAIPANALACQSKAAQFPLTGGALKCCDCERWHNVPEKVMDEVRCPSSERSCCDVIRRCHRHSRSLTD